MNRRRESSPAECFRLGTRSERAQSPALNPLRRCTPPRSRRGARRRISGISPVLSYPRCHLLFTRKVGDPALEVSADRAWFWHVRVPLAVVLGDLTDLRQRIRSRGRAPA